MVLDDNSMLQADVTLLAGLFILLTLLSFKEPKIPYSERPATVFPADMSVEEKAEKQKQIDDKYDEAWHDWLRSYETARKLRNILSAVTLGAIIPFSLSAIFIILGFGTSWDLARYTMVAGFVYLIIAVTLLVMMYREASWLKRLKREVHV
jgi:hypothetical protein